MYSRGEDDPPAIHDVEEHGQLAGLRQHHHAGRQQDLPETRVLEAPDNRVSALGYSPDSSRLAIGYVDGSLRGSAHYRQQLPDEWWYHVRVYDPHGYVRLLFVRYPEYVRKQSSDR